MCLRARWPVTLWPTTFFLSSSGSLQYAKPCAMACHRPCKGACHQNSSAALSPITEKALVSVAPAGRVLCVRPLPQLLGLQIYQSHLGPVPEECVCVCVCWSVHLESLLLLILLPCSPSSAAHGHSI